MENLNEMAFGIILERLRNEDITKMNKLREKWSENRTEVDKGVFYPFRHQLGIIVAVVGILVVISITFYYSIIRDAFGFSVWLLLVLGAVGLSFCGIFINLKSYAKTFTLTEVTKGNLIGYEYKGTFFEDFGEAEAAVEAILTNQPVPSEEEE